MAFTLIIRQISQIFFLATFSRPESRGFMDKPPPYLFSLPSPCRKLSPAADVIRSPRSANHITHETVYHPQTLGVQSIQQCHDIRPQTFLRLVLTEIKKFVGAHLQCSGNTLQRLKLRVAVTVLHAAELAEVNPRIRPSFPGSCPASSAAPGTPSKQYRFSFHTPLPLASTLGKVFRKLMAYSPNYHSPIWLLLHIKRVFFVHTPIIKQENSSMDLPGNPIPRVIRRLLFVLAPRHTALHAGVSSDSSGNSPSS